MRGLSHVIGALVAVGTTVASAQVRDLIASPPGRAVQDSLRTFGQLVGNWRCQDIQIHPDGTRTTGSCEWSFGWILGGRAVQDVFMSRGPNGGPLTSVGTTIRVYDPRTNNWQVTWASATSGIVLRFTAHQAADSIVMVPWDTLPGRRPWRWEFLHVTADSFQWQFVTSPDSGKTWIPSQIMHVHREATWNESDSLDLIRLEEEWLQRGDSATLERILGPDFQHPVFTGDILTKAEQVHWVAGHPDKKGVSRAFDGLDVRIFGAVGVVTGTVVSIDVASRRSQRTVFTDIFVYRDGRWQAVNAQENAVRPASENPGPP